MKTETQDLTGPALDWAVAKCEGIPLVFKGRKWSTDGAATIEYAPWAVHPVVDGSGPYVPALCPSSYNPSTNWSQGGPIIERERIQTTPRGETTDLWEAIVFDNIFMDDGSECFQTGPAPLIAAMRCYVASRLGDEVDIPEELTEEEA
jgi:hypothetical protein